MAIETSLQIAHALPILRRCFEMVLFRSNMSDPFLYGAHFSVYCFFFGLVSQLTAGRAPEELPFLITSRDKR